MRSLQATIYEANKIGEGSIICTGGIVTSNATIGRFFHCNIQSYVAHDCVVGDFVTFAPRVACNGNVVIEDHAYVGTGAVIREGKKDRPLRIGSGAIVGDGRSCYKGYSSRRNLGRQPGSRSGSCICSSGRIG